jgi:hypothetical protein
MPLAKYAPHLPLLSRLTLTNTPRHPGLVGASRKKTLNPLSSAVQRRAQCERDAFSFYIAIGIRVAARALQAQWPAMATQCLLPGFSSMPCPKPGRCEANILASTRTLCWQYQFSWHFRRPLSAGGANAATNRYHEVGAAQEVGILFSLLWKSAHMVAHYEAPLAERIVPGRKSWDPPQLPRFCLSSSSTRAGIAGTSRLLLLVVCPFRKPEGSDRRNDVNHPSFLPRWLGTSLLDR